jgi:hypothetical protein
MADDIATALATMTADNLPATDRWEICKQQPTPYRERTMKARTPPPGKLLSPSTSKQNKQQKGTEEV